MTEHIIADSISSRIAALEDMYDLCHNIIKEIDKIGTYPEAVKKWREEFRKIDDRIFPE